MKGISPAATATSAASIVAAVALLAGCLAPSGSIPSGADDPPPACADACRVVISTGYRHFEPTVAIDPHDPNHLVAASRMFLADDLPANSSSFCCWGVTSVSRDGGATWTTDLFRGGPSEDPRDPLFGYNSLSDPNFAFLPDGTVLIAGPVTKDVIVGNVDPSLRWSVFVARSRDGGLTWPEVSIVKAGDGAALYGIPEAARPVLPDRTAVSYEFADKEWMAVGPDGTVLITWSSITGVGEPGAARRTQHIAFASSSDGGRTWTEPGLVAQGQWLGGSAPVILTDGRWVVAYADRVAGTLLVATSDDRGATWASEEVAPAALRPSLRVARNLGEERLVLAYASLVEGEEGFETPTLRESRDGGATWGPPVLLDVPENAGVSLATLDVSPDGTAYVAWFHVRSGGDRSDLLLATVRGGAASPPRVIGTIEIPTSRVGHYFGLAADDRGAFLAWVDETGAGVDLVGGRIHATSFEAHGASPIPAATPTDGRRGQT
ncbi:MAG: sialidase family protein [Methanobacteriota archaeon]